MRRIREKMTVSLEEFLVDLDCQEIVLFSLQMAVQNYIDITAHIISEEELGIASSTNEMFYVPQENGYIRPKLTENMVAAVGLRNLVVHEYGNIDLKQVYQIANQDIDDLEDFVRAILKKCEIA
jgi:uncharacterized protein YutE (UPF0331/DUF86 family)